MTAHAGSAGERLLVELDLAHLSVITHGRFQEALAASDSALAELGLLAESSVLLAEGEAVRARIVFSAATHFEVAPATVAAANSRLERAAAVLAEHDRLDESFSARIAGALRLASVDQRLLALSAVAESAAEARHPAAGDAHLASAELLLDTKGAADLLLRELALAEQSYRAAAHEVGTLDVELARARLAVERDNAPRDRLRTCADGYAAIDYPRGMLSALLSLSQLAQAAGDVAAGLELHRELEALTLSTGVGLTRASLALGVADLLVRRNAYREAIDLCRAEFAQALPVVLEGNYRQLVAGAFSALGDGERALAESRASLACYERVGADALASIAVGRLANQLFATRGPAERAEAWALLQRAIPADEARGELGSAVSKLRMLAQGYIYPLMAADSTEPRASLIERAEQALAAADLLVARLHGREAALESGNGWQMRAQIANTRGDLDQFETALLRALEAYQSGGFELEAANCHYLVGCARLNRANVELTPHAEIAEQHLSAALDFNLKAGMRDRAADCRWLLGQLFVNAALRLEPGVAQSLLDAALAQLSAAEQDYDAIRRDYRARSALEAQDGKRALVVKSARIYTLGLQIVGELRPNRTQTWAWVQRAKARALGDLIGAPLPGDAPPVPLEPARVQGWLSPNGTRRVVCVDWFVIRERLWMSLLTPEAEVIVVPLGLGTDFVRAWVARNFAPNPLRSTLKEREPSLLRELDPLVAPLLDHCARGDLLVLSPTAPLHGLPLHALQVGGEPLLARHPIVYSPSLAILRECVARPPAVEPAQTALFGDPRGDRPAAAQLVEALGVRFDVTPALREAVTREAVTLALSRPGLFHFQGHARYLAEDPLGSYLELANEERLTVRELLERPRLQLELVALAACESAVNEVAVGDEPTGLVPAFLYAGAKSALATLWTVPAAATALAMDRFYAALGEAHTTKADALQQALLAVRRVPGYEAPYYWAGLVLSGNFN